MLRVLKSWLSHVTRILIADERVQQDIVKFEKQGQTTMLIIFALFINGLHRWQEHFSVDDTQVLEQASVLLLHFLALTVLFLVINLLLGCGGGLSRDALLITLVIRLFALFGRFYKNLAKFLLLVERHV